MKKTAAAKIKKKIVECDLVGEVGFYFNIPSLEDHKFHLIGDSAASVEPIDERVRNKLITVVREGEWDARVVSRVLEDFSSNSLGETDRRRRRFYPDFDSISRAVSREKSRLRHSKVDQENVQLYYNQLASTDCNALFRPCTEKDPFEAEETFVEDNGCTASYCTRWTNVAKAGSNLLFVYQSKRMQALYHRYGPNSVLVDATYRTSKYALPLYFVVVETNAGYQVICFIITQYETEQAVTEGLLVLKGWNPSVSPKYAMVDYAWEEINSLEKVFPGICVFICSFHREQAWDRWMKRNKIPKEALPLMRKVANAETEERMNEALQKLVTFEYYGSTKLQEYFETYWLPQIKRWSLAKKPLDIHCNTNNGVERMNKELKSSLNIKGTMLLSELIKLIVEKFLIDSYKRYSKNNSQMSPLAKGYNKYIPKYLHGRPKWLIEHVMEKMMGAVSAAIVSHKINKLSSSEFSVPSFEISMLSYSVVIDKDKNICRCTCADFMHFRLVCKHIILVGSRYHDFNLEKHHRWIFVNPIFNIDDSIIIEHAESSGDENNDVEQEGISADNITDNGLFSIGTSEEKGNGGSVESATEISLQIQGQNLETRDNLLKACRSKMRELEAMMYKLETEGLSSLRDVLNNAMVMHQPMELKDRYTQYPIHNTVVPPQSHSTTAVHYGKVPLRKKRKCSVDSTVYKNSVHE